MTEIDLIYETSQQTDIPPLALIEKTILCLDREYKIRRITDYKIAIEYDFDKSFGSLNYKWKLFRTILYGNFEVGESKITFNYEIDVLRFIVIFIIITVVSLANCWSLLLSVPFILQQLLQIVILKNESQKILKAITANTDQPITTKFKSIRFD